GGVVTALVQACGWGALFSGLTALYFMHRIYRIKARPFWNHWQVLTDFYGSMLVLGPLLVVLAYVPVQMASGEPWSAAAGKLAGIMLTGLLLQAGGLFQHARDLQRGCGEAQASHFAQTTTFGKTWLLRNAGMGIAMLLLLLLAAFSPAGVTGVLLWSSAALLILLVALIGRALFYALVIPTTLPGAFFWRNRGFEEHAREIGLAEMPQVGVLPECH
ncbi:MAG: dimethyl sulfoxide reductase anchor subunit, partial [Gammaproteobacteria bacterium]